MPSEHTGRRLPPMLLRLDHEQNAGHHETGAANDLRSPIRAVELCGGGESSIDAWERSEAGDPEDGRAEHLRGAGEEAEFVEVVRTELVDRWIPGP